MKLGKINKKAKAVKEENKDAEVVVEDQATDEQEDQTNSAGDEDQAPKAEKAKKNPRHASQRSSYDAPAIEEGDPEYECVLSVKEDDWNGQKGAIYEGSGLKDEDRLNHLLGRGAIRKR